MTVSEIYRHSIKPLAAADRLQLARIILNDIPAEALVDYSDSWTADDLREFTQAGWLRVEGEVKEREDDQPG